ncbi:MAG: C4-dicarboxylate TRAP transporter substrate-binding protein [Pseudomonadota bacterium]
MSMRKRTLQVSGILAALVATAAVSGPALATKTIKLTAIDGYPARAMWVKEFSGFFIPKVNEKLAKTGNYKIEWQESYGGTIVKPKGVLEGIKLGLGDIGIVTTIFHNSKLPSQAIAAVTPFIAADARVVAKAVDEIAKEFPQMAKELDAQNQVYLATGVVLDSYQVFSKTAISSIKDLKGSKVAAAGYNMRYVEGLGAVGVRGGLTNFYNMLQTGVVSQAMLWPEAAKTFKIADVAPYLFKADLGAVNSKTVTINKAVWNKLPDEVKNALQQTAVAYRDHVASVAMSRAAASIDSFKTGGGKVVNISDTERKAWASSMENIAVKWATDLDKKGAPGSAMLRAYIAKLKAAGFTPVRDWAAELPAN